MFEEPISFTRFVSADDLGWFTSANDPLDVRVNYLHISNN